MKWTMVAMRMGMLAAEGKFRDRLASRAVFEAYRVWMAYLRLLSEQAVPAVRIAVSNCQ